MSLTFAILHLLAAGQEDVWSFDFMDRPAKDASAPFFSLFSSSVPRADDFLLVSQSSPPS